MTAREGPVSCSGLECRLRTCLGRARATLARTDSEVPLMRHGDQYPYDSRAYAVATYDKMAINMVALRGLLGGEKFLQCYHAYGQRWLNKHPTPFDFWNTFNWCSGQD